MVGGRLTIECIAAARKQTEFNLVELLPNGSLVPVKIGGKIKRRLVNQSEVHMWQIFYGAGLYANMQRQIHVFQKLLINIYLQYMLYSLGKGSKVV